MEKNQTEGLTDAEARKRLEEKGPNELPGKNPVSARKIFFKQFDSLIMGILAVSAAVSGFMGEWKNTAAIGAILLLNAVLGFMQEFHAEKSLAALRKLFTPSSKVIRGGRLQNLPSREIVPGDLILIEQGDQIPADGRIVRSFMLRTQEAALTGESMPVSKDAENMAFMGTSVSAGKAYVSVTATGLRTELGKIASMLREEKREKTPLERKLDDLGKRLVYLVLGIVASVFAMGLMRGYPAYVMFLTSLSLAVAAIPEGLPAVVTIALALGVKKMAGRHALVRRLASVETLGCATVICTDKTGTLTKNEMTVRNIWTGCRSFTVTGTGYGPEGEFQTAGKTAEPAKFPALMLSLKIAVLCSGAKLFRENGAWQVAGDPTEGALLAAAEKAGLEKEALERDCPLLEELPFDSERKRMSVYRKTPGGPVLYVKGAPDVVLGLSEKLNTESGEIKLTGFYRDLILGINHQFASEALRVLAVAYKKMPHDAWLHPSMEQDLVFAGLMAMMDAPRSEAKTAIETCKRAGIRPVMITGDHQETAAAIALELGLMERGGRVLSGAELESMDGAALREAVRKTSVYARVSPEHKLKIVRALKQNGEIAAMTGDGVNDAPAIKESDIGVAMGLSGTDVAREASNLVITDDNFASIVSAVEEGRGIYDSIVKFVNYLVSHNLAEIFVLFFSLLFGLRDLSGVPFIPLTAVQILWMNLVTDGLPALALSLDPVDPRAMSRPPRSPRESILPAKQIVKTFLTGTALAAGALFFCAAGLDKGPAYARSMVLTALIFLQFIPVHLVRAPHHLPFFSNPWLIAALLFSCLVQAGALYVPFFQKILGTAALDPHEWPLLALTAAGVWFVSGFAVRAVDLFSHFKSKEAL